MTESTAPLKPALELLARAFDKEDASQRGEPDPWLDGGDDAEWVSERLACAQVAIRAYLAASRAPQEQGVKVRALIWNEYEREGVIDEWDAFSGFDGYYNIKMGSSAYVVLCPDAEHECDTLEAAKAAAQADYERRILSALSIQEPASEPGTKPWGWTCTGFGDGWEEIDVLTRDPELASHRANSSNWTVTPLFTHPPAPAVPADLRPVIFMDEKGNATTTDGQAVKAMFNALPKPPIGQKLLTLVPASFIASLTAERDEARRENSRWQENWDANVQEMSERFRAVNVAKVMAGTNIDLLARAEKAEAALAGALEALNPFAIPLGPSYQALDDREQFRTYFTLGNIRAAGRIIQSQRPEQ
ncbi:hypothetical protein FJ959_22130 [Mesorhizobium sp. B2-2-4]|uniref:hypothetical protein n=1 Tax=unclassified Mesorhizobium TaxID=325217 RepID=UPI001127806A|nr:MULTISPECIES: hypothetical protein [unclassified Mesorhizobium]TPM53233.1 hypothetical protein FJ959_22130 [Mesorhizobium sp. B2-2-4]TPM62125.1 hypothetical protein FJ965_21240 [Mesorhizobium sp. B2-2-1]TPN68496.1 hypothetical protein FJ984_11720 [Mesorhizobium sp. B1-1-3]